MCKVISSPWGLNKLVLLYPWTQAPAPSYSPPEMSPALPKSSEEVSPLPVCSYCMKGETWPFLQEFASSILFLFQILLMLNILSVLNNKSSLSMFLLPHFLAFPLIISFLFHFSHLFLLVFLFCCFLLSLLSFHNSQWCDKNYLFFLL